MEKRLSELQPGECWVLLRGFQLGIANSGAAQHLGNPLDALGPPEAPAPRRNSSTQPCRAAPLPRLAASSALQRKGKGRKREYFHHFHSMVIFFPLAKVASRGSVPRQGWLQNLVRENQQKTRKTCSSKMCSSKICGCWVVFLLQALSSPSHQQCPVQCLSVPPAWAPWAAPAQHPRPCLTVSLVSPG